jgi:hypothetical protein
MDAGVAKRQRFTWLSTMFALPSQGFARSINVV